MVIGTRTKKYINQIKGSFGTYCDDQPGTCSILRSYTREFINSRESLKIWLSIHQCHCPFEKSI